MARQVFERDLDALFVRNLGRPDFADAFLGALGEDGTLRCVATQTRHERHAGSIDLDLRLSGNRRLLVENKIDAAYSVTHDGRGQPERYAASVQALLASGIMARSVLLAPRTYLDGSRFASGFDICVAYEDLRPFVTGDDLAMLDAAIAWAETPYEPDPDTGCMAFFHNYAEMVRIEWPSLMLKRNPNAGGVRPTGSRTIYFDTRRILRDHPHVPRPRASIQSRDSGAGHPSAKLMIGGWGHLAKAAPAPDSLSAVGAYLRPAGRSLGIVIDTPAMEVTAPFASQAEAARSGLQAMDRLRDWWNRSGQDLADWLTLTSRS